LREFLRAGVETHPYKLVQISRADEGIRPYKNKKGEKDYGDF